jgi:Bacterial regulatory proteins, tetR family
LCPQYCAGDLFEFDSPNLSRKTYRSVGASKFVNMPRVIKHPDLRRSEILDQAIALFLSRGYDTTSLNDIIAEAGISKGAFYHYFPSKEALIAALEHFN